MEYSPGLRPRWLRCTLVVGAGLLLAASFRGAFDPGALLILKQAFAAPDFLRASAFGLIVVVAALGLRGAKSARGRAGLVTLMVAGLLAGLLFTANGFLVRLDSGMRVTNSAEAPEGRPYRAIMLQSDDSSDGLETVVIRTGHGALTKQWVAACEGQYELRSSSWTAADQLAITLQDDADPHRNGETFVIQVDPQTGKPQTRTDKDLNCL